ncbi:hypothetical protein [Serratia sp. (in: enterobacteria)]|uniref:hypothetical protein n=1 Tax=Serratia sp. (in: enterobacteria) TaxID=616 RepID=UPI00398A3962
MATVQEEKPKVEIRDIKSRRIIKLLFHNCPLCKLKISMFEQVKNDDGKQYFQLVQYGANPDGTGYESYYCQSCDRFFMMIIGAEPIMAKYEFKPANEKPKQGGGGIGDLFAQIFGGGGNGQGGL